MSDVLRLRIMARKSVFTFGKWDMYTVQQVLDLKGYQSLRWYYYNCSMVSFLPDILDELWITEEWRITKPGTDPEKGKQLEDNIQKHFNRKIAEMYKEDPDKAMRMYTNHQKHIGINARDKKWWWKNLDRKMFSKASMQRRNHGH